MTDAKTAGIAAARAQGAAETQAQQARNAQQAQQSKSTGTSGLSGNQNARTFDKAGNLVVNGQIVQFASRQAQETYLAQRGVGNTGQIVNEGLYSKADFTNVGGLSNATKNEAGQVSVAKPADNFGYSGGVKVAPIVQKSTSENPLDVNYIPVKNRTSAVAKTQLLNAIKPEKPAVETPQAIGRSLGSSWVGGQRQVIGAKIFSKQVQLTRGSPLEDQTKASEAVRASKIYPSTAKEGYLTSKESLSPTLSPSTQKALETNFDKVTILSDKNAQKNSQDVYKAVSTANKKPIELIDRNTSTRGIYNAIRTKTPIDLVGKNVSSKGVFQYVSSTPTPEEKSTAKQQQKEFASYLSNLEYPGVTFNIKDSSGKIIATTSGQRSRYDFLKAQEKYGNNITIEPHFNFTPSQFLAKYSQGPKGLNTTTNLNATDVLRGGFKGFENVGAGIIGIGSSFGEYALNAIKSFKLEKGQIKVENQTALEKARQDISYSLTGGYKVGSLLKGNIELKENPPLTKFGQTIINEHQAPTYEGATLGTEKIKETPSYYAGSALFQGFTLGLAVEGGYYGAKGLLASTGTGIAKTGIIVRSPTQTIIEKTPTGILSRIGTRESDLFHGLVIAGRPIIGKTPSGWVGPKGAFEGANLLGEKGSVIVAPEERGTEIYTKPELTQKLTVNNPSFFKEAEQRGLLARGPAEIKANELRKGIASEIMSNEIPQKQKEIQSHMETTTPTVEKAMLGTIGKQQSRINILNPKTGKAGPVQGSRATAQFLSPELTRQLEKISPVQDIDVIKTNALGLFEENQGENLAKQTNLNVQKEQGIAPQVGTVFRGLSTQELDKLLAGQIKTDIYTTPNIETAAFYGKLNTGPNYKIARLTLESEKGILSFKNIPKSIKGANPIGDWRESNPRLISYAKGLGFLGLRKPIKTGGEETILFGSNLIIKGEILSPRIQITLREGRKIYAEPAQGSPGGKALEYVTKKEEVGSSVAKTGKVLGYGIDKTLYKSLVPESTKTFKHTSGKFQFQTNIAKMAIQTEESAKAQNATPEQLAFYKGGKFLITSEAFAPKAVIRNYLQTEQLARDLIKNPSTKERGEKLRAMNEELFDIEAPYHNLTREGLSKSSNAKAERESEQQTASSLYSSGKTTISGIIKDVTKGSSILLNSRSNISGKSGISVKSQIDSILNGKSSISGKSSKSDYSSLSGKSNIYGKSAIFGVSNISGKSNKSSISGKSGFSALGNYGISGRSGTSGYSGYSGTGISGVSGLSGKSGFSGISGSGISGISGKQVFDTTNKRIKVPILVLGAFTRRPRYRPYEKPTRTFLYNVPNIFAASLSIIKSKRR